MEQHEDHLRVVYARFCRCRPTEVESVCVLEPTIVPVRVPILGIQR